MSVSSFQVRELGMHGQPHAWNSAKSGSCVFKFVCTYIWKAYYLHSFQVFCDVLSSMITIVKFCLPVISLVIK